MIAFQNPIVTYQTVTNPWILIPKHQPNARLRLFCLPYAGAGPTVFRTWPEALDSCIEVVFIQFPGRGARYRETPLTRLKLATEILAQVVQGCLDLPYALFGHSLGALTSFELAREMRRKELPGPVHLFMCARPPVHLSSEWTPIHHLPDEQLVEEVQYRYGGIPQVILEDVELLQLFLPVLRADLEMLETYEYIPEAPLSCDMTVYSGYQDRAVKESQLDTWEQHTTGNFSKEMFPGNHFFVQHTPAFFRAFASRLAKLEV
jgi:medium-chain acyl-[acyl-carrier-protein] hydrolase